MKSEGSDQKAETITAAVFGFLILTVIVCIILLSLTPPIARDELTHHLSVPKRYVKHGGVYEIPTIPFSYYPMNVDLLYMIPLYFGNDRIPKWIHFSFALLTAGLIFSYLKSRLRLSDALMGVVFFLSVPMIVKLSITAYVDLGLICFSTASLIDILKWMNHQFQRRFLIRSAVFCGLALGTKYNGLVPFFLLSLFIPFIYSRFSENNRLNFFKSIGYGLTFCLTALLVFSPWMIRNYYWKHNPIYPLYDHWFNPPQPKPETPNSQMEAPQKNYGLFTYRSVIYNETPWQIALLPVRIFFEADDSNPFDGKLNPLFLIFSILAFYPISGESLQVRTEKKILLAFGILYFAITMFTTTLRIRYISPIIPMLAILSAFGVRNALTMIQTIRSDGLKNTAVGITGLTIAFLLSLNGAYVVSKFKSIDPLSYLSGTVTRDEYLARFVPEYPAMQFINQNLPENALVMFVWLGMRGYYCDREYRYETSDELIRLIKTHPNPSDVCREIQKLGGTHLAIHIHLMNQWIPDLFSETEEQTLKGFLEKHLKLLFFSQGVGVFEMLKNCDY